MKRTRNRPGGKKMKTTEVKDKTGKTMQTQTGVNLVEHTLEEGDIIIPSFNSVNTRINEYTDTEGKKKAAKNYSIKALVKNKEGQQQEHNGEKEIFVKLTEAQANSLTKKAENGVELTQNMFIVYKYENQYGEQLGIGLHKERKKPKTFEDFENETKEE